MTLNRSSPKLSLNDVPASTKGRLAGGDATRDFYGVSTDTRSMTPDALFVAITGEKFDAHDFFPQALQTEPGVS